MSEISAMAPDSLRAGRRNTKNPTPTAATTPNAMNTTVLDSWDMCVWPSNSKYTKIFPKNILKKKLEEKKG